jgi:hypothetical protein
VKLRALLLLIPLFLDTAVCGQDPTVNVNPKRIAKQTEELPSCGFASILNCLAFGSSAFQSVYDRIPGTPAGEKLSFLVNRYGSRDSVVKPGKRNYIAGVGMHSEDILATFNALLSDYEAPPLKGMSADRLGGETSFAYLRRIHQYLSESLLRKIPVVATVESYAAYEYKDNPSLKWKGAYSHSIVITSIPRALAPYEKGFAFRFVDSLHGAIEQGYVYTEDAREFQAVRRTGSGFEWISGSPFLLVILPSLGLATELEPSNNRTIMTLSYIIGRY